MVEGKRFEVVLTKSSILRLMDDVYPYLERNFTANRVLEVSDEIFEKVDSLAFLPYRSPIERSLNDNEKNLRFLLYRTGSQFELKILFYIDESALKVFVTDFFPTRMNPARIKDK